MMTMMCYSKNAVISVCEKEEYAPDREIPLHHLALCVCDCVYVASHQHSFLHPIQHKVLWLQGLLANVYKYVPSS